MHDGASPAEALRELTHAAQWVPSPDDVVIPKPDPDRPGEKPDHVGHGSVGSSVVYKGFAWYSVKCFACGAAACRFCGNCGLEQPSEG